MEDVKLMTEYTVFIGYDEREKEAYEVCKYTIEKYASEPVRVLPLDHRVLRGLKMFNREWKIVGEDGTYLDKNDGRPFSTQFSHSRFVVPHYANYLGYEGMVMFVDPDFLFCDDVVQAFKEAKENHQLVSVVKHEFHSERDTKLDNRTQRNYKRKLWSSLMIFDMRYYSIFAKKLPLEEVSTRSGQYLHGFKWLLDSQKGKRIDERIDEQIGSVSEAWNFIPGHSSERFEEDQIMAIHYTETSPWFHGQECCSFGDWWLEDYIEYINQRLIPSLEDTLEESIAANEYENREKLNEKTG
jgi:lipopolysaccharide biosynthesis glycosyltransferase